MPPLLACVGGWRGISRDMDASIGILAVRIVVGLLFVGHGTQKLFGWFGGGGPSGTEGMVRSLGYPWPRISALFGGVAETLAGCLLALGLVTPLGAFLVVVMMVSAIAAVHASNGVWNQNGGIEYPLVLIAVAFAAACFPGRFSFDHAIDAPWDGVLAAIVALVLGAVVAGIGLAMRRSPAAPPREEPPSTRQPSPTAAEPPN